VNKELRVVKRVGIPVIVFIIGIVRPMLENVMLRNVLRSYQIGENINTQSLSFNGAQSRVVIGLLTGHNTLRRHLHIMGLVDSPLCRKCGAGEETSDHVLCECEALSTLRHIYLGSFFLDPDNVRDLSLRAIWNFFRRTGLL
jgi:hypothetical protein